MKHYAGPLIRRELRRPDHVFERTRSYRSSQVLHAASPGSAGVPPASTTVGLRPTAGGTPALVWSAPRLQGGCGSGKQGQLHTCIRPLEWERLGSRALMESAHASPHLPDGLERAQRGHRLVACRSDLSCHRLHVSLATVGGLAAARNRLCLVGVPCWLSARRRHVAISTGCPRVRPLYPARRWAGGGDRALGSLMSPSWCPVYAGCA